MSDNNRSGRGGLYFIVGALVVAVMGLAYIVLGQTTEKPDLSISVNEDGIEVEGN